MNPLNHTLLLDCISEVKECGEQEETKYLRDKVRRLQQRVEYLEMVATVDRIKSLQQEFKLVRHGECDFLILMSSL